MTDHKGLPMSGFCMWPGTGGDSHQWCKVESCICSCHAEQEED